MGKEASPLEKLRTEILNGATSPRELAERALKNANQNAGRNVYISRDENWTPREADRIQKEFSKNEFPSKEKPPLFGLPISLKDSFDPEGFRTTAGTRFSAQKNEITPADHAVAKTCRAQGAGI